MSRGSNIPQLCCPISCCRVFDLYLCRALNEDIDVSRETWKGITYGKSDSDC